VPCLLISAGSGTILSLIHFARKQTAYPRSDASLSLQLQQVRLTEGFSLHTYANRLPLLGVGVNRSTAGKSMIGLLLISSRLPGRVEEWRHPP
jgi:hypothetical protein